MSMPDWAQLEHERQQRKKQQSKQALLIGVPAGAVFLAVVLAIAQPWNDDEPRSDGAAAEPAAREDLDYELTLTDEGEHSWTYDAQVGGDVDLQSVLDEVVDDEVDADGDYWVTFTCAATGERVANGKHAEGALGAAALGLDEGETVLEPINGATCS